MNRAVRAPVNAYISLGANLGDPRLGVLVAIEAIADIDGVALLKRSSLYATAPVDAAGGDYVNAVVKVSTQLDALQLLAQLQHIETLAGRVRSVRNAPRLLDLDLLLFGAETIRTAALTVPHPRLWERAFVLVPLHEVEPVLVSPARLRAVQSQAITLIPAIA